MLPNLARGIVEDLGRPPEERDPLIGRRNKIALLEDGDLL